MHRGKEDFVPKYRIINPPNLASSEPLTAEGLIAYIADQKNETDKIQVKRVNFDNDIITVNLTEGISSDKKVGQVINTFNVLTADLELQLQNHAKSVLLKAIMVLLNDPANADNEDIKDLKNQIEQSSVSSHHVVTGFFASKQQGPIKFQGKHYEINCLKDVEIINEKIHQALEKVPTPTPILR